MAEPTQEGILEVLKMIIDPEADADIVSLGMVSEIVIKDGNVGFAIEVAQDRGPKLEPLRKAAERAVYEVPGVLSVTAVLTAEKPAPTQGARPGPAPSHPNQASADMLLSEVGAVIAIASGKGGVGKSTAATNIALALAAEGLAVGMLDADIYGPSMPLMLGIDTKPVSPDGKSLLPIEKFGLKCMSIGFLIDADTPMIWRGPMVTGALEQLMRDVQWGPLDVLVVDMPPGTGDIQLTMAQRVPLAGAIIISTPQDLSLLDARKGLNMFRKVDVPVLGIVENMSYFICPNCGHRSEIFSHGGARREAEKLGIDFLGEIPLDMAIRETSDAGRPIVASDPDNPLAEAYRVIARTVWGKLGGGKTKPQAPRIVIQ